MRRYFILAIVVGLVMAAGIAVAQEVVDDGVIYACADKDGDIRMVDALEDCEKKESSVYWNRVGPAGPAGQDGADGEVGEIVMTTSGNAWFPQGQFYEDRVEPYERWATETTFFVPVRAVISLTGPGSIDGVDYGLESFDLCVITDSNYVSSVSVTGIESFGPDVDDPYLDLFHEVFAAPGLTTGCRTFVVNASVGQGAGLMVEVTDISDGSPVTLFSVKSVWTPEAAT